jgi:glycosyltransferase involved in cell wall biosynthesis
MGVVVCHQPLRGYGNAYLKGMAVAKGKYLVMADADDTYDFNLIPTFIKMLDDEHYDFVTGSRYLEGGDAHITFLHRFVGNPALTAALNLLFGTKYTDVYCGFRAFSREAFDQICPLSPGMEFNLELAVNAKLAQLKIGEVPIVLAPRIGQSKLHTLKDGWRSLRMMILYCPNKVFLVPGLTLLLTGSILHLLLLSRLLVYNGRQPGAVSGIVALILCVSGFQVISLWLHAKTYSWSRRFETDNSFLLNFYKYFNLETGLIAGAGLILTGMAIFVVILKVWFVHELMPLNKPEWAPFAATLIIIGNSCIFSSIFISAMSMRKKP